MPFYFFERQTYSFTILGKSRFSFVKLMFEKFQFPLYTRFNFRNTMGELINGIILCAALNLQIIRQLLELCKKGCTRISLQSTVS